VEAANVYCASGDSGRMADFREHILALLLLFVTKYKYRTCPPPGQLLQWSEGGNNSVILYILPGDMREIFAPQKFPRKTKRF